MENKTAMQQLLHQMREERTKLPIPIEWDRAYQAIEMMIKTTYIPMEKEQIIHAFKQGLKSPYHQDYTIVTQVGQEETKSGQYYNETYGK